MITIKRWYHNDCAVGRLTLSGSAFQCFTLELPWLENEANVSCIPKGTYKAFKRISQRNGSVFELRNVPQRSSIQCHGGNYTRQIQGCILVGSSVTFLDADTIPDVTNSKDTLAKLLALLPDEFEVTLL
jgi:hypothetical protein